MIRIARTRSDIESCILMQLECLPDDEALDPYTDGIWWIASDERGPLAFGAARQSARYVDGLYMSRAGVLPHARGEGLQRELIRTRVAYAKRNGYRWVTSDTCDNVPSANNLIACGFKLIQPAAPWGLDRSLYWARKL
jgi:GNAT superfamily N-acetyltransferase